MSEEMRASHPFIVFVSFSVKVEQHLCRQLVLTCAVASTPVQLIPNITFTSEQTRDVLATSTDTDVSKCAFVYICKIDRGREREDEKVGLGGRECPAVRD